MTNGKPSARQRIPRNRCSEVAILAMITNRDKMREDQFEYVNRVKSHGCERNGEHDEPEVHATSQRAYRSAKITLKGRSPGAKIVATSSASGISVLIFALQSAERMRRSYVFEDRSPAAATSSRSSFSRLRLRRSAPAAWVVTRRRMPLPGRSSSDSRYVRANVKMRSIRASTARRHLDELFRLREYRRTASAQGSRITWTQQPPGDAMLDHFAGPTDVRGDYRHAEVSGFQHDVWQALREAALHDEVHRTRRVRACR